MAHWYRAYGLVIRSDVDLPEFLPGAQGDHDLAIHLADDAAEQWAASGGCEDNLYAFLPAPVGGYVMRVPGVCDYWVRDGREINIAPAPGSDIVSVRLFLLGSAFGMAFHQRGLLVLHGATVLHARGASIFVGQSGQGKSTLAASLGRAGYAIFGDDTMPLWPSADGGFEVWPGSRMFKLWSDTIGALGASAAGLDSVGQRMDKYFFPNAAQPEDRPTRVFEIVELVTSEEHAGPVIEPLRGLEALRVIAENTYRPQYVPLLGQEADHFRLCSALTGAASVCRLHRPWAVDRIGESIALIRSRWERHDHVAGGAR